MTTLGQALDELVATVESRASADPSTSYTAKLIASGPARCAKKLGEEAVETALAAVSDTSTLAEESADLLYHLIVTLKACNVPPSAIADALARRRAQSGLEEKAGRGS
ncbi:MAG: phosphoribosyl-ATP diphosphatase [Hyphomonadaceae bacterium]|nr:phosphoribosyl-ATP diphosphatase [Hyphomonadaceae bacterium]